MNTVFWNRLFTFLNESKLSFETIIKSCGLSILFCAVYFIIRFLIVDFKKEKSSGANTKTRIQMGIEFFIDSFLDPFINDRLNSESKEIKKHLLYCDSIREDFPGVNLRDENLKLRNIRLNMSKKYWASAVHVILEKMIGEKIPEDSKELDMELIRKIHNAMSELYDCNQNSDSQIDLDFDSVNWSKVSTRMITGSFLALFYYAILICVMGATSFSSCLAIMGLIVMFLFRKKTQMCLCINT